MSRGYVYILSNPSMPDLIKIGRTARNVQQRASELYQTGVPTPFKVHYDILTPNCIEMESAAHEFFAPFRISDSREFFAIAAHHACDFLTDYLKHQLREFVNEFDESLTLVCETMHVDENAMADLADQSGLSYYEVAGVFEELLPQEIEGAKARYKEKFRLRKLRISEGLGLGSLDPNDIQKEIEARDSKPNVVPISVAAV